MNYNRIKIILAEQEITGKQLYEALKVNQKFIPIWCTNKSQSSIKSLYEIAEF